MPLGPALPLDVADALSRGWTVVTANQRATRWLRREFDAQQRAKGLKNWQPPQVLAWETWLQSVYRQMIWDGHATETLLNGAQEHALWRAVISEDASMSSLRPVDALAEAAASAWALLHAYRGRDRLKRYAGNSDTRVFAAWVTELERKLKRGECITAAQLPQRLNEAISARQVALPGALLLVGFDGTTPALDAVVNAASSVGVEVLKSAEGVPAISRRLVAMESEREELIACARWARQRLEQNPVTRIAVIVPAIEPVRADIEREFRNIVAPELNDVLGGAAAAPYEFSLGVPLAQMPLVTTALAILRWSVDALPLEQISSLLLSPYFAGGIRHDERLARAELDAFVLRRQRVLQPRFTADGLHRVAIRWPRSIEVPVLMSHLAALRSAFGAPELPLLGTHADWAETITDMLSAAGWTSGSDLNSAEFQTRRKWESALDEFATLDFDGQRVPFAKALDSLEYIASRTLFAPESRNVPIQIMGPLESAGSHFDSVWFLRASDAEWATTSSPNPLLPWQLQRDFGMPGAVPSRDMELAQRITRRIGASGAEIVFSYSRESADGPQRPSPILTDMGLESLRTPVDVWETTGAGTQPAIAAEILASEAEVPSPPDVVLRGGAAVLERQAACAFRAFAEMRLLSAPLDSRPLGMDARERGSLVHRVLELFWKQVHSQAALLKLGTEQRNAILDSCIQEAIGEKTRTIEPGWGSAYLDTERQRLRNLLQPWLDYEALKRSPFLVKAVENEHPDARIGPLRLRVKVDRVDSSLVENEPSGDIILDYKTGVAKPADWSGDRPDAPQLPLYAVMAGQQDIAGVAFAIVRPGGKMELRGFEARPDVLPKTGRQTGSLAEQVEQWGVVLEKLAEDFHSGKAEVRPKNYPETCRYCQQRLLCRLDISSLSADETEEPEEIFVEEDYG